MNFESPGQIIEILRQRAMLDHSAPAIVADGRAALSYGELLEETERIIRVIIAAGVGPNDRVAIVGSSGPEMVLLFLAVTAIAACAPLNPSYTAAELDFYLRDLAPRLLIVEKGLSSQALEVAGQLGIPILEMIPAGRAAGAFSFGSAPEAVSRASFAAAQDTALVLHTSGTTGRPKMVPLTQRNLCFSACNIGRSLELAPNDRCLSIMPLFHIHGLIGAALSTIASGGSLACPGAFRAPEFPGWIKRFQPTWYTSAPSLHAAVFARSDQLRQINAARGLRFIRSCSAPLPPQLIAGLEDLFGAPLVEAYGMTEAAHQMACNPLPPRSRKPGSVGIATGTEIAIMDGSGKLLSPNEEGEIVVRGASVMDGYVGAAGADKTAFTNGWFRTGDQGRMDEEGYVFITGRIKEIINRGGEKISPREIDEVLLAHPGVAEAVAFALPDVRLGEDVGAAVVCKPNAHGVDARSLLSFAETRLAPFKLPRRIIFVPEIPRGPTGKPQRIGLAKRLGLDDDRPAGNASVSNETPSTPTEQALLRLCRDAFELQTMGIHDDFFDSGGDSLSAMKLLCEVEHHWNIMLTLADMLDAPTIASFAKVIDHIDNHRQAPRLASVQAGGSAPPFFCVAAGPGFRELARLLGPEQPFLGPVHPEASILPKRCRIEDVAAHHVQIIRNAQPHGPYFIGGWCVDGLVAYEIAQQLRAAGEPVALLVLFDTSFYLSDLELTSETRRARANRVAGRARSLGRTLFRPKEWHKIAGHFRRSFRTWSERIYRRPHAGEELREAAGWREVAAILTPAALRYRPSPYDGRILLLNRSSGESQWKTRTRQDWLRLVSGRLDMYDVPGDHVEMFEKPNVAVTAEKLGTALREAQAGVAKIEDGARQRAGASFGGSVEHVVGHGDGSGAQYATSRAE
jgi:oxalate---CoA ligase